MRWFLGLFLMKACSRPAFGCRRLYCGIRICVGRIETVKSPLIWYRSRRITLNVKFMCEPCRSVKWVAVTRTCSNLHWVEVHQISGFWGGSLLELVLYRRWLVDQLLLGFAHIVYTRKGKRVTSEYWIVSRLSVRWSSTSTIRTLMAWRSNIPQKSFLFWEIVHPFFRMICILHANGNLYNWPSPVVHFLLCFCAIKNA